MADLVGDLEKRAAATFEPVVRNGAGRSKRSGKTAPAAAPPRPRMVHTTVQIADVHRAALRSVAVERMNAGETARLDVSDVIRELIDFWRENPEQFARWRERSAAAQKKNISGEK